MTETIEEIDAMIEALKAKKRRISKPVIVRKPKLVKERHARKVVCTNCGQIDSKTNMQRVSRYEYQHAICPTVSTVKIVRFEFS